MEITFRTTEPSDAELFTNLFEFYLYDLSTYADLHMRPDGAYVRGAPGLARYWDGTRTTYLAFVDGEPAGFGAVWKAEEWLPGRPGNDVDEFFVVRRFRRSGLGSRLANHLWASHPGPWLVRVVRRNEPALAFWEGEIAKRTGERYEREHRTRENLDFADFTFET